jgi:serine/threonine-protein kinase
MAPERLCTSGVVDARSDIWSLGVILYELVAGRGPFQGRTREEIQRVVTRDPCPAIGRSDVPAEFERIVARCLAKDPRARFQRATELAAALAPFAPARGRAPEARPAGRGAWRTRRRWAPLAIAAALAVAGASWLASSPRRMSPGAGRDSPPESSVIMGGPPASQVDASSKTIAAPVLPASIGAARPAVASGLVSQPAALAASGMARGSGLAQGATRDARHDARRQVELRRTLPVAPRSTIASARDPDDDAPSSSRTEDSDLDHELSLQPASGPSPMDSDPFATPD